MLEIKVTVEIPDLVRAAQMLAGIKVEGERKGYLENLEALKTQIPETVAPYTAPAVPLPDPTPVTPVAAMPAEQQAVSTTKTAPVITNPAPVITNPAPAVTPAPAPVTPPTAAPAFTLAQVSRAGADLLTAQPSLQPKLVELIGRFGGQSVKDIPTERLGEFAAELRKMGAKI